MGGNRIVGGEGGAGSRGDADEDDDGASWTVGVGVAVSSAVGERRGAVVSSPCCPRRLDLGLLAVPTVGWLLTVLLLLWLATLILMGPRVVSLDERPWGSETERKRIRFVYHRVQARLTCCCYYNSIEQRSW